MNYESFKKELVERVNNELSNREMVGIKAEIKNIDSPDGMNERLAVSIENSNMSMAFRLQEMYEDIQKGESIDRMVERTMNTINENVPVIDTKSEEVKNSIIDYEKVKDNLYLRLIPGDSPVLSQTPHKMIGDLALVVNVNIDSLSDGNGRSVVMIQEPLLDLYGIDKETLFDVATENSIGNEPVKFVPMLDMLRDIALGAPIPDSDEPGMPETYIATNASGFQGAAVLGYPDFFEKAEEVVGGSFYVIPSSVHEFILIKDDGKPHYEFLDDMIRDVNSTVLSARDILSDHCYHWDAVEKEFQTGEEYEVSKDNGIDR